MEYFKKRSIYKITIIYFVFSSLWIILSDSILYSIFPQGEDFQSVSIIKGLLFISLSTALIGWLVHSEIKTLNKAEKDIAELHEIDLLTGLYNRQTFDKHLHSINPKKDNGTIVLFDINGLRVINEVFSYEKGNELLKQVASIIEKNMPKKALISRYGGDEFVVYLAECKTNDYSVQIDDIIDEVNNIKIEEFLISISSGYADNYNNHEPIYDVLKEAENNLFKDKMLHSKSASNSIIRSLKTTLFERSDETQLHADRMEELSEEFASKIKLSSNDTNELKLLAILHDIGKIGVTDTILKKPGPLTTVEYEQMKLHPSIGYKMANAIPQLESIAYPILTHHEWYDGNGYPKGLQKDEIPLLSRILSIIDAYDAMTNDRIYRKALSKEKAITELKDCKGTQFDPELVDVFLTIVT